MMWALLDRCGPPLSSCPYPCGWLFLTLAHFHRNRWPTSPEYAPANSLEVRRANDLDRFSNRLVSAANSSTKIRFNAFECLGQRAGKFRSEASRRQILAE